VGWSEALVNIKTKAGYDIQPGKGLGLFIQPWGRMATMGAAVHCCNHQAETQHFLQVVDNDNNASKSS